MTRSILQNIRIILVEPAGALNVGSVARVMKNMGLQELFLVNPHCNPHSPESRQMAVHAGDILDNLHQVSSLTHALQDCQRAIATTARTRTLPTTLETPKMALPWLLEPNFKSALIFGPEDRGLNNQELNYAQRFVCIPSNPDYPSLNLAQAVAVCVYELYQASLPLNPDESISPEMAKLDDLERYYQHLATLLLKVGYLHPHTASARMEKFRRLYHRAQLSPDELAMLRGILSQIDWALDN
jgi:tRNA/rRNA methyltransferase